MAHHKLTPQMFPASYSNIHLFHYSNKRPPSIHVQKHKIYISKSNKKKKPQSKVMLFEMTTRLTFPTFTIESEMEKKKKSSKENNTEKDDVCIFRPFHNLSFHSQFKKKKKIRRQNYLNRKFVGKTEKLPKHLSTPSSSLRR